MHTTMRDSASTEEPKLAPPPADQEKTLNNQPYDGNNGVLSMAGQDTALGILELVRQHDQYHPIHWPTWKKWVIISIYCLLQVFVTITSTSYVSVEFLIMEKYGGSTQVVTLGQSMFIVGNAVGPAFLGPLS